MVREGVTDRTQTWDSSGGRTATGLVTRSQKEWYEKALDLRKVKRELNTGINTLKDHATGSRKQDQKDYEVGGGVNHLVRQQAHESDNEAGAGTQGCEQDTERLCRSSWGR